MAGKKVVMVTGGNSGLGFETVRAFRDSNVEYDIIIGSLSLEHGEDALKTLESEPAKGAPSTLTVVQVDLTSDDSIAKAAETIKSKFGKLDILVNNGGVQPDPLYTQGKISLRENFTRAWNTNTAGTMVLTHTLVPLILAGTEKRLVFITSGLSSLHDVSNPSNFGPNKPLDAGWPKTQASYSAYRTSKAGINMIACEWARILHNDGVKVITVSPGLLQTNLGGEPERLKAMGALPVSAGADVVRGAAEGERDADLGKVIRVSDVQPW